MSWDQQAYSFGTPNAQPPTPTKTPTSAQLPSPTFQTPRNGSNFENRSGWTPTFAEEYSVFNSTPGRLTGDHHSFVDTSTPDPSSTAVQNRPLSGDLAAELATHVHHLSPNPNIPLPPVDASNQLPSSPGPYQISSGGFDDSAKNKVTPRKSRKSLEEAFSGQTATPPQSSKGSRKLAPKISTGTMQNDSQDSHYGISSTPTQGAEFSPFPSTSADIFGFPMSAPATAPVFTNTKPFWDPDSGMGGMDLDFTTDDASMFATGSHRIASSFDWGRNNQMFQENVNIPQQNQDMQQPAKRQRPLAPKAPRVNVDLPTSLPPFEFNSNNNPPAPDDPFSAVSLDGSVDPGLLFSRNNSISMTSGFEDVALPTARPATSHISREPYQHQLRESRRDQEELRRSRSSRESSAARRFDRGTVSSPIRGSARPGLQRSNSDNRGKKTQAGRILPRTGRSSPIKQPRPSSLTSIPESPLPKPRTEVIFTIDSKGKARTETIIVGEEPRKTREVSSSLLNEKWDSSSEHSSTDEEPIIIPSRNTSFNLPPQQKGPKLARFETSNRSNDVRKHSTSVSGYSHSESSSQQSMQLDSLESEAETVMEDDDGSGDATRELRKVLENRKKNQLKQRNPRHHHYASDSRSGSRYYNSSSNNSPTTVTDPDGATPSSAQSGTTRCVCSNGDSEGLMIQCESCDYWLHGQCVNIDEGSLPPVYICAFCAQTPNMRGGRGRLREPARAAPHLASSPLAHKSSSFKSFR